MAMVMHAFWCYIFVDRLDWGIAGTGYANVLNQFVQFCLLVILTNIEEDMQEAIVPADSRMLNGLWSYAKLGVPSTIMICLDQWCWELMIIMTGYLGVDNQASQIVLMNIVSTCYMVAIGLETTSCTIIGQEIGKGDVKKAK